MPSSNNSKSENFKDIQYAFTRHMRDPENEPAPTGIEDRRMEIYRGLLYRNVESFLAISFPVLRKITADVRWHNMMRDYFKKHQAHTPLFPKMPQEFLQYLETEREQNADDYPFNYELAHYEWTEVAVSIDPREIEMDGIDAEGDLFEGRPVLSPLAWPLAFQYPVHRISPDLLPEEIPEQPTYLLVYRNKNDDVNFIELNPVSARLIELIQQNSDQNGRAHLKQIADEMQHPNPEVVIAGGKDILETMLEKDIVLGVKT